GVGGGWIRRRRLVDRLAMDPDRPVRGDHAAPLRAPDPPEQTGRLRAADLVRDRVSDPLGWSARIRTLPAALHLCGAAHHPDLHPDACGGVARRGGVRDRLPPPGWALPGLAH